MAKLDKDTVINAFTQAYEAKYGKLPQIDVKSGWYSVDGGKNIRLAQLQEMTDSFAESQEVETETQSDKPVKAAKAAARSTTGFSVKAYWAEHLKETAPGATLPR